MRNLGVTWYFVISNIGFFSLEQIGGVEQGENPRMNKSIPMHVMDLEDRNTSAEYPTGWLTAVGLLSVLAILAGAFTGDLLTVFEGTVIALIGFAVVTNIAVWMARSIDAPWLPGIVAAGFLMKIFMSVTRYLALVVIYNGSGDAVGYHGSGVQAVEFWRSFQIPPGIGTGTEFVNEFTGLLYVPYVPQMLGGFFMYSTLAFLGQMLMYAALRQSRRPRHLKWYAIAIFFVPAITYWPASIGKESLMFLGIGLAVYGASLYLRRGGILPLVHLALGLGFAGVIRPHISALIIASLAGTLILARGKEGLGMTPVQRWIAVVVVGLGSIGAVVVAANEFNISLEGNVGAEVDEFVTNIEDNTSRGGSEVEGSAVSGPQDVPGAMLRVLFRPLPYEAHNPQALASSLESLTILLVIVWRIPAIFRNRYRIRREPYLLMSLIMTFGFAVMFSPFLNLGLLARERSQVLPFLAVAIIQLGWGSKEDDEKDRAGDATSEMPEWQKAYRPPISS